MTAEVSAWLGGDTDEDDHATLVLTFRSETASLGTYTLDPVVAADREDETGLLPRAGARPFRPARRPSTRRSGSSRVDGLDDGAADELSLVLAGI